MENMYRAKTHLSRLVEKAVEGEEVILAKAGKPLVRLVPYEEKPEPLKIGLMAGKITISKDFDESSPEWEEMFREYM